MAIQDAYNYEELGLHAILIVPSIDNRFSDDDLAVSRTGLSYPAIKIDDELNIYHLIYNRALREKIDAVIIDEAQFLTVEQVDQLAKIVDMLEIPVIAYGLKTTFKAELFPASKRLLELADKIEEPRKTLCWCGKKAIMNARVVDGKVVKDGDMFVVGGNDTYKPLCRKHYNLGMYKK